MRFEPHGEFRAGIVDRVFCLEIRDAWNLEGLERYLEVFKAEVARLIDGRPWASIVDVSSAAMATPDTFEPFNIAAREATEAGRTHLAVVGADSEPARWQLNVLFEDTRVEIRYFEDSSDAWEWLQSLGFCKGPPTGSPYAD